jgi:hypothetical protein
MVAEICFSQWIQRSSPSYNVTMIMKPFRFNRGAEIVPDQQTAYFNGYKYNIELNHEWLTLHQACSKPPTQMLENQRISIHSKKFPACGLPSTNLRTLKISIFMWWVVSLPLDFISNTLNGNGHKLQLISPGLQMLNPDEYTPKHYS